MSLSFVGISATSETLGVNVASFILGMWSVSLIALFGRIVSKITTSDDTLLFLFPMVFSVDLVQASFYLSNTVSLTSVEFWALLGIQELQSIILNTGLKNLFFHQVAVFVGKAQAEDNPFAKPQDVALIVAKAHLDALSEQLSMLVIIVASLIGVGTRYLGATVNCFWCNIHIEEFIPIAVVVVVVRVFVLLFERKLLQFFHRRWSKVDLPSFHPFYISKFKGEGPSLAMFLTLAICGMYQVLAY